ncbi:MAG: septal ring lytic transglycosylase RlpA family protein [Methylococcales bacterium]|nr:septal ring lytic transglycosylase RlpA family protein [Methylococcales bacterium]
MLYQSIQYYGLLSFNEKSRSVSNSRVLSWTSGFFIPGWLSGIRRVFLIGIIAIAGCNTEYPEEKPGAKNHLSQQKKEDNTAKTAHKEVGVASWYGPGFQGQETASGEKFDQKEMTAAHPSLPIGTKAQVTNLKNDKKVDVTINDRGPFVGNRKIDVSNAAAKKLGMEKSGTTKVKIEAKKRTKKKSSTHKSSKTKSK